MIDLTRRLFVRAALITGALTVVCSASRASWPGSAFAAHGLHAALNELLGTSDFEPSHRIRLSAPETAENGGIVPVTVTTDLEGVESISLIATRNPRPLTSSYIIPPGTLGYVSTRIKMQETADIIAIVKVAGRYYGNRKRVVVAVGGCT
jgi:sulfur-oxidizing protein SoxY